MYTLWIRGGASKDGTLVRPAHRYLLHLVRISYCQYRSIGLYHRELPTMGWVSLFSLKNILAILTRVQTSSGQCCQLAMHHRVCHVLPRDDMG